MVLRGHSMMTRPYPEAPLLAILLCHANGDLESGSTHTHTPGDPSTSCEAPTTVTGNYERAKRLGWIPWISMPGMLVTRNRVSSLVMLKEQDTYIIQIIGISFPQTYENITVHE